MKWLLLFAAAISVSCSYSTEDEVAAFVDPDNQFQVTVTRSAPFLGRSSNMSVSAGGELRTRFIPIPGSPAPLVAAISTDLIPPHF
jgi:hypothetical protein